MKQDGEVIFYKEMSCRCGNKIFIFQIKYCQPIIYKLLIGRNVMILAWLVAWRACSFHVSCVEVDVLKYKLLGCCDAMHMLSNL